MVVNRLLKTLLLLVLIAPNAMAFAQVNATVGGTVSDTSGALIPGVTVTAKNTQTGVVTTVVSNETGAYQFANLQTGTYSVTAELPGFRTQSYNDVALGIAQQVRLNFSLQVGGVAQQIEVAASVDTTLATSSSSIGTVLPDYTVKDLPLGSRNVLDLVTTAAGVQESNFAGHRINQVATTRDGINVADGRYDLGVFSQTYVSPDLVEEVRIVVSSADPELGKAGGVQLSTRAGTNTYTGSVFWTNHNTALDANTWSNNRTGAKTNYLNRNQYGGRLGGPIKKNKAFFFFLYEGQKVVQRSVVTTPVLTASMRQGIFRYFPGVVNGNADSNTTTGATPQAPVVDVLGNPVRPAAATGGLVPASLYGVDPLRPAQDPTGRIGQILANSPLPNYFGNVTAAIPGDGLNIAGYRFVRRTRGVDGASGDGVDVERNQVNLRIDYNFNSRHKLFLVGTRERVPTDGNPPPFPDGKYRGMVLRTPQVYTGAFVSTLSASMLNEVRFGYKRGKHLVEVPYSNPDNPKEEFLQLVSTGRRANGSPYPFLANPINFSNFYDTGLGDRDQWSADTSFADTLSVTRGRHAFKFGGEGHLSYNHSMQGANALPTATMGAPATAAVTGITTQNFPGLIGGNQTRAQSILADLSGGIASITQNFELESANDPQFRDFLEQTRKGKHREIHQNSLDFFFKDDWKIRPSVTVNLGLRWDYFGSPYDKYGLMGQPKGGKKALHGLTGTAFDGSLTLIDFVGKNSTNPAAVWQDDYNNFGPTFGISWSIPYFGKDKTVLRAGYGLNYQGGGRTFSTLDGALGSIQGLRWSSINTSYALAWKSFEDIVLPLPRGQILDPVLLTARNVAISGFEDHYTNPYVQNYNVEIQRQLGRGMTLEVSYVSNKSTKLFDAVALNQWQANTNAEFLDAFKVTQQGGNAPLFDRMLMGLNVTGFGVVDGTTRTGSAALRTFTTTRAMLANGSVGALGNFFNTTNAFTNENGGILRNAKFPENYFVQNPQFSTVTLNGNGSASTYHSMIVQVTKRLSRGFSNQTSYTLSKGLGDDSADNASNFRDVTNRRMEKTRLSFDRTQSFRSNGTYELPFGPNKLLLRNAPGWLSRIVERWQFAGIANWTSGAPLNVTATNATFSSSTANTAAIVGDFPKTSGTVVPATDVPGALYFQGFTQSSDPSCSSVTSLQTLNTLCTNLAIKDPSGKFILVNPQPGQLGNLGKRWIEGPSSFSFDMNLIKRIKIAERNEFELRVDAINVLNHSNWANPTLDINSANFGRILNKTGNRTFTLNTRLNF